MRSLKRWIIKRIDHAIETNNPEWAAEHVDIYGEAAYELAQQPLREIISTWRYWARGQ